MGIGEAMSDEHEQPEADEVPFAVPEAVAVPEAAGEAAPDTAGDAPGETTGAAASPEAPAAKPEKTKKPAKAAAKKPKAPPAPKGPPAPQIDEDAIMRWYILKVQSNRENSICDGLKRRVAVAGLDEYFGQILVPTEDVAEFKNGKRRVIKRKLYPGYIVVQMLINEDTWFLVRETPGIGDFTGAAGKPAPMLDEEVERIVKSAQPSEDTGEPIKTAIPFKVGDRVRVKEGTFENFEGDVDGIDEANGRVTVMINIFNRTTPVEVEHWQVEAV